MSKILKKILCFAFFGFALSGAFAARVKMTEDEIREQFIQCAKEYLGTPYVYAGESKSGVDCSGLIFVSAKDAGLGKVAHSSAQLYKDCKPCEDDEPKAGDLIFFAEGGSSITHVGIYLGDGEFIHAASAGRKTGVIITKLSETTLANSVVGYKALITPKTVVWKEVEKKQFLDEGVYLVNDEPENDKENKRKKSKEEKEAAASAEQTEEVKPADTKPADKNSEETKTADVKPADKKTTLDESVHIESNENSFGKKLNEFCELEGAITFDWSFIKPTDIDVFMQGISLEAGIRTDTWIVNPGLLVRVKFLKNNTKVKGDGIFGGMVFPVCLSVSYDKFMVYGGIVGYIPNTKENVLYGTNIKLAPQLWPGIFGASVNIGMFRVKEAKIVLYQDINYVCLKPQLAHPTNQQIVSGGLNMSTGIKVAF